MTFQDAMKWNKIASAVYALGVWTMIGSYAIFKYTGRIPDLPVNPKEDVEEPEDPYREVYETSHSKTVIIYKKDFVPYRTRITNFIQSFSSKPSSGDSEE